MPIYNARLTKINRQEMLRYAGLAKKHDFAPELIELAAEEALLLADARGAWQEYAYDENTGTILANGEYKLSGEKIKRHLTACERVIVLCVTVGEAIENAVTENFSRGNYALSVLIDAAATAAVEQVADDVEAVMKPGAKKRGFTLKTRFSPGYGDWSLTAQRKILALSGGKGIGVTLTESLMLTPRKSVTAVIGLSRVADSCTSTAAGCAACGKTDCPFSVNP